MTENIKYFPNVETDRCLDLAIAIHYASRKDIYDALEVTPTLVLKEMYKKIGEILANNPDNRKKILLRVEE